MTMLIGSPRTVARRWIALKSPPVKMPNSRSLPLSFERIAFSDAAILARQLHHREARAIGRSPPQRKGRWSVAEKSDWLLPMRIMGSGGYRISWLDTTLRSRHRWCRRHRA